MEHAKEHCEAFLSFLVILIAVYDTKASSNMFLVVRGLTSTVDKTLPQTACILNL